MAATPKFLPKQLPTDVWSLREKVALGCSVKRSGDNNWVSVSRAIKPYGESERPSDWFSQKNCALQYSDLLEKVETPKRKRGEREAVVEAPGDVIVRKLTIERIEELKRIVQEEQKRYKKLKQEVELTASGHADDRLTELWDDVEREKKEAEDAEKAWTDKMAARETLIRGRKFNPALKVKVEQEDSTQDSMGDSMQGDDSNLSQLSVSTPQSSNSQSENKPSLNATVLTLDQSLQGKADSSEVKTATKSEKTEPDSMDTQEIIPATEIKTEPGEIDILTSTTIKEEVVSTEEVTIEVTPPEAEDTGENTEISDDTSTVGRDETVSEQGDTTEKVEPDQENESDIYVHVVDDKDDKSIDPLDSTSETPSKDEDPPLSPSSSVMSNDTDGGSFIMRGKGRPRRERGRGGRRNRRYTRNRLNLEEDDKAKESETSSKAESSDDEDEDGGDNMLPESDDTASNATGKMQMSFTESIPNSPASIAPGDTEDEKAHKVWKKSIMLVWRAACNHKYANVFSHPVTEEIAPGYHSVVQRPLDLSQIKKNIESGQIRCTAEFQRDMMLMFTNAIMYNNSDHDVFHMATEMYDDVMRHIEQYVHTQIMVQGGETKLLRTSRRSEVQSDKEEEPKRKRQSLTDNDGAKTKKRKLPS